MKAELLNKVKRASKSVGLYPSLSRIWHRFSRYPERLEEERSFYEPFLKEGDLCFDVGANVGRKSQAFLELGADVVAFEPQPNCAEEIRLRCGPTEHLRIHNCAIGAEEAMAQLDVSTRSGLAQIISDSGGEETITVDVYPLNRFIEQYGMPKFCKIDVEGYELQVMKGLSQLPDALSFEYHATSPEKVDHALACLKRIRSYGADVELNYTERTNLHFQSAAWMSIEELERQLRNEWKQMPIFGDIFVKRT